MSDSRSSLNRPAEKTVVRYVVQGDFNRLRADHRMHVQPSARVLKVGDCVIVEDGEGNSCEGVVDVLLPMVRVDLDTWKDADD